MKDGMMLHHLPLHTKLEELDRFYRAGGLQRMASPHVHYLESSCPHAGCEHRMEWIDFQLELHGDPEGIYKPLVKAWWLGEGFVRRSRNWIKFTSMKMHPVSEDEAKQLPSLPDNWHTQAMFG